MKSRKPIRRRSLKMAAKMRQYAKIRTAFLAANPLCVACGVLGKRQDPHPAVEIHHKRGRFGSLLLKRTDQTILAIQGPTSRKLGDRDEGTLLESLLQQSRSGHYWGLGKYDRVNRLITYRASETLPLTFVVGISEHSVFAQYNRQLALVSGFGLTIAIILACAVVFDLKMYQRLARLDRTASAALESMSQGLCMFDGDNRLVTCNERYRELYQISEGGAEPGMLLRDILEARRKAGLHQIDADQYVAEMKQKLREKDQFTTTLELNDGKKIGRAHV